MTVNIHAYGGTYTYLEYFRGLSESSTPWKCFTLRKYVAFQKRHEFKSNPNQVLVAIL